MSDYEWKANLCCVATYKTLESDHRMDQFEEAEISFDTAKDIKMEALRYYPKTTTNPDILEVLSFETARNFLKGMVKDYSVKKEKNQMSSAELITELAGIFKKRDASILDLAAKSDALIKFADE